MKCLTVLFLTLSFNLFAQDKEADLQIPVSDISEIQREEADLPPTLEEVEMKQEKAKSPRKTKPEYEIKKMKNQ
jgi:hypothetical protein